MAAELIKPENKLFKAKPNSSWVPWYTDEERNTLEVTSKYIAVGRFLACAIMQGMHTQPLCIAWTGRGEQQVV